MNSEETPPQGEVKDIRFKAPTFIDPLTGLLNQYYLYQFLPEEMEKAKLSNYPLTIFMIDLDGFKDVNDAYGHLCGDEVLKQLTTILKRFVRQTDMVIRYAGDEFAMILPAADQRKVGALANRFIEEVANNVFRGKDNQAIQLTISVGFATYPDDAIRMDQLIDLADKALYLSKKKGKNRVSQAKEVNLEAASYLIAMDSFPCPKFIDRETEMGTLKQTFDTIVMKSNFLQIAFISGDSGVGKTRLLNEFNNYVRDQAAIIHCRGSFIHRQDPYYLFAKGISNYVDKTGIDNVKMRTLFSQIPFEELTELGRLIPAISYLLKRPMDLDQIDKKSRFLLFKSFLDFLIELNKIQAVVVSFDDIHWADKASLELVRYLSKQEKNKRIFIVCSFIEDRPKEPTSGDDLKVVWEDIRFNDNFTHIKLTNFSLGDTASMVESIFAGLKVESEFYELIHSATQGNSSFIEEMLKSLVENAIIFYQDNRWQIKEGLSARDIPVSIEEVIQKRLKNLDEETKEMIVQAAVIGEDFSVETLSKIDNKDEGFMLELLDRARKMRLVDELEPKGKFGFTNANIQNLLYNGLDDERRSRIHHKIGQSIAEMHKGNIYNVASELAFHFSKTPQLDEAAKFSQLVSQKITQIFEPSEVLEYLERLTQEVISGSGRVAAAPLANEEIFQDVIRLVRFLQGAVKNFQLYPPGIVRTNSVKETYALAETIFKETEGINLSEVEKSLVINGRRIPPKEAGQANIESFVVMMMEHNLKTISLIKEMTQDGLHKFIQYLSQGAAQIKEKGGWTEILNAEAIRGIKIDEVHFFQLGSAEEEFAEKKKIEDIMLIEFLLDKIEYGNIDRTAILNTLTSEPGRFANSIMDAASMAVEEGRADTETKAIVKSIEKINSQILDREPKGQAGYLKELAGVISWLKPALRNKVIRSQMLDKDSKNREMAENIIGVTPDEVILDMIVGEYRENQENLLALKDFVDKILTNEARKKDILMKLNKELSKMDMDGRDLDFVSGKIKWEDLPLDRRINNIFRLPDEYYGAELGKIKTLLEELDRKPDKDGLGNLLHHLLAKGGQLGPQLGRDLLKMTGDFVKAPFVDDKLDAGQMEIRLDGLLKRLNIEADPNVFSGILDIFREIIKEFTMKVQSANNLILEMERAANKKDYVFIQRLLSILAQRYAWDKEHNPAVHRVIHDFVMDISSAEFLEILVYSMLNNAYRRKTDIASLFSLIGDRLVDVLIEIESRSVSGWSDSFREYIIRRRITDLFQELGEPALNRLKQRLSQKEERVSASLIELVGYLKKEEWIEVILPFLRHRESGLRRAAIRALGDIGGARCLAVISQVVNDEKERSTLALAKRQLRRLKSGD